MSEPSRVSSMDNNSTRTTTNSVVKESESMIAAQVTAKDHRGVNSDSMIGTDHGVKLLYKAVKDQDELHDTATLNNTEQQAGCSMANEEKRAARTDCHGRNYKNKKPEAKFDKKKR